MEILKVVLPFLAEIVKVLAWPVVIIAGLLFFRPQLADLLKRLRSFVKEGNRIEAAFESNQDRPDSVLPQPGQGVMTAEEVRDALLRVPLLKNTDVENDHRRAHILFLKSGIVTKNQLDTMLESQPILEILKRLYTEELLRPPESPLDPVGLAVYGPLLFTYGTGETVVSAVRNHIRTSMEYRQKH